MTDYLAHVPVALLMNPDLPASAKLAWMIARLRLQALRAGRARPTITSALSRPAMLRGMARLAAAGWDPLHSDSGNPAVAVPAALLMNRRLGIETRVLYGLLHLTPEFQHPCGQFTYAGLADLARTAPATVAKAVRQLAGAEWVKIEQAHRLAPVHFQLTFPGFERQITALAAAQTRLERANFFGEQLMREYLSLLADSDDFEDDAAPGFLVNPRTGERLQFDRFYPPALAWEFNGAQHYRATEKFSAEAVARQQERDYIKIGICVRRKITLVVVEPDDLTLAGMREKIGNLLPVRDTAGSELLADFLEAESRTYRRKVARL
jgi:hypothetical protein